MMAAAVAAFFNAHKAEMIAPMLKGYSGKDAFSGLDPEELAGEVQRLLDLMDLTPFKDLPADLKPLLEGIAKDGAREALSQVNAEDIADALSALDERAVAWAEEREAEMVGMKVVDGELVQNPDASWRIDESTRDLVRADVTQAMQEGWSNQTLAHALEGSDAFSRERANSIARTETAYAARERCGLRQGVASVQRRLRMRHLPGQRRRRRGRPGRHLPERRFRRAGTPLL